MRRFSNHADGVELTLFPEEAEALVVMEQLLDSVGSSTGDPAAERLAVPVYPGHPDDNIEFEQWLRPELDNGRAADRSAVATTLSTASRQSVVLSPAESESWLLVLNEARLALAARMEITEEGWGEDLEELTPEMALLHFLTYLHGELTQVLSEQL